MSLPNFSVKTPGWGTDFPEPGHVQIMGAHFSRLHSLITKPVSFDLSWTIYLFGLLSCSS